MEPRARAPGSLHGVRVLDFTRYLAGPFCTMMLAEPRVVALRPNLWTHAASESA